jgi:hypothetical protein
LFNLPDYGSVGIETCSIVQCHLVYRV